MTGAVAVVSMTALFLIGILVLAPRAGFNIFPPQKDSTLVAAEYAFDPGTSVEAAAGITGEVNRRVAEVLGDDLEQVYVYLGDANRAFAQFRLSPRGGRPTAPQLVDDLLAPIGAETDGARVTFNQVSNGPPEANFPFRLQVFDEDPADLERATAQILAELDGATIERSNGTSFEVVETAVEFSDAVARSDGRRLVQVRARYDADDVTTTTSRTQDFLEERFDADRLAELGLAADAFGFDFGLESDNQESFASMPRAFGIALVLMVLLLIVQFRSSIRWLLVFLAIPFGFFGVFAGLLATDNEISFFVMLGLLGLIGIAVNNTILLTDFANQERASGVSAREAMARALERRLRPLLATTLTTIAGLLPLALSDPFWESLAFTIIFGLISSTLGVVVAFPYCYLAVEWLRDRISTPWSART